MSRILILISFLLIGCGFDQQLADPLARFDKNKDIIIWNKEKLPLNVVVDESFSEQEILEFDAMVSQWEFAANTEFVADYDIGEHKSYNKLEDYFYKDSTIGLHRALIPVDGLGQFVLGACQIFIKYNHQVNDVNIYEILHADIIINDYNFDFAVNAQDAGYDLRSVFLHEMGHFVGLVDNSSPLMSGTMGLDDVKHEIDSESEHIIYERYSNPNYEISNSDASNIIEGRSPASSANGVEKILVTFTLSPIGIIEMNSSRPCMENK